MWNVHWNLVIHTGVGLTGQNKSPATSQTTRSFFSFSTNDSRIDVWYGFGYISFKFWTVFASLWVPFLSFNHLTAFGGARQANIKWNNGWPGALTGPDVRVVLIFSGSDWNGQYESDYGLDLYCVCYEAHLCLDNHWTVKSLTWIFQLAPWMFGDSFLLASASTCNSVVTAHKDCTGNINLIKLAFRKLIG